MAEQSDPIQAQLVEARRNQILDAATKVFAEKGFARATIKEIARVAGVADGTIYIYFKNKEDLMLGLMHRINQSDQRAEDFAQAATQPAEDFSVAYFRQRMEFMGNQMATFQAILQEVLGNETLRKEYLEKVIEPTMTVAKPYFEALIANRTIRPIEPAMTINVITGSVLGVLLLRMLGYMNVEEQWEELPEVLFEILFKGLQPR
ncbi:MAG: TetR/AcrR family transcriptional regulator [Caldilineaceae bacterium]